MSTKVKAKAAEPTLEMTQATIKKVCKHLEGMVDGSGAGRKAPIVSVFAKDPTDPVVELDLEIDGILSDIATDGEYSGADAWDRSAAEWALMVALVKKLMLEREQNSTELLLEHADFLVGKNQKYGNSALCPKRIFSRVDPLAQLDVRIDDKLSRLANQAPGEDEDPAWDFLGYLVLKRCAVLLISGNTD